MKKFLSGLIIVAVIMTVWGFGYASAATRGEDEIKFEIGFVYSNSLVYAGAEFLFQNIRGSTVFLDPNDTFDREIYSLTSSGKFTKEYRKGIEGIDLGIQIKGLWAFHLAYTQGKRTKFQTSNVYFDTADDYGPKVGIYERCARKFSLMPQTVSFEIQKGFSWIDSIGFITLIGFGADISMINLSWDKELETADITGYGWGLYEGMKWMEMSNSRIQTFKDNQDSDSILCFFTLSQRITLFKGLGIEVVYKRYPFNREINFKVENYGNLIRPVQLQEVNSLEMNKSLFLFRVFYQF